MESLELQSLGVRVSLNERGSKIVLATLDKAEDMITVEKC